MKKIFLILVLLTSFMFAKQINVAVAANVSYAIDDLIKEFKKNHPDVEVKIVLGSSGKLTAQIKNGAPYDLFMSANMKYPQTLYSIGFAINEPIVYAKGSLAMLSAQPKELSEGLKILENSSIKKIAIANPKTAPYGIATKEALENSKLYEKIKDKIVFAESISQTVSYTVTAADIGFVAKSSLYSPKMTRFKKGVNWMEVDKSLYNPINQGIVILKKAKDSYEAKAFFEFIQSNNAKKIFKDYGYQVNE